MNQLPTTRSEAPPALHHAQRARFASLYAELQPQLWRILTTNLAAPAWLHEEACQTAWESLLARGDEIRPGGELSWLSTTATRYAIRALRRERLAGHPLAELDQPGPATHLPLASATPRPDTEHACELHARLASISHLPPRTRRMLLLHSFGYEYSEIAQTTGNSPRTVIRQLTRAREHLRLAASPES